MELKRHAPSRRLAPAEPSIRGSGRGPGLAWVIGALLALWSLVIVFVSARVSILGRFDDGIEYTTVTYLLHGQIPFTDFYEPYGLGLGIPGVFPHLLGFGGAFALRLTYGLFPPLVTLLVTPLVWRRCGAATAVIVGLITITSGTPRYSMGFAALFGFASLLGRLVRRTPAGTLQDAAASSPRGVLFASFICSLAGWARTEYAVFAVAWAVILLMVLPRGRRRTSLVAGTLLFAVLPSLIVVTTGGWEHLWWFVRYTLSTEPSGFHAQRGLPIEWHLLDERLTEVLHLQFGASTAGAIVGSYGVAVAVVAVSLVLAIVPAWRPRLLKADRSYLVPFMVIACAVVFYGQLARFSPGYGEIGNPVFWVAGAMLLGRPSNRVLVVLAVLVAYPFAEGIAPGAIYDEWAQRPPVTNRVSVPGFNRIPMGEGASAELGATSMVALIAQWHRLGLDGRATFSVELRNDVAWGNEAIVGYLLNAPAAAWPLTYDPGLANSGAVEHGAVAELCKDRAPVVQADDDFPYPQGKAPYIGSRLLDEFLAADYEIAAVAGWYRILLPSTSACVLPQALSDETLRSLSERWLTKGELAEAGALAIARMERASVDHERAPASDAALAALGGYVLTPAQLPPGALGRALLALSAPPGSLPLASAAAAKWPSDIERLAAQTAWVAHRTPGEAGTPEAVDAVSELASIHPNWPQAITNLSAIVPGSPALFAQLEKAGARGIPAFDSWRWKALSGSSDVRAAIGAGLALIEDHERLHDMVAAGEAELELANYGGVTQGCAQALRHHASSRPGVRAPQAPSGGVCSQREIALHAT